MSPTNLSAIVQHAAKGGVRKPPPLKSRKPTGKPSWPIVLLAGGEKAGKSYSAAVASGSKYIGRTFWLGAGEDDPDEYGAIPGASFEILEHDGTYDEMIGQLLAAVLEPREDPSKPNLIVIDSGSRIWELLSGEAQALANARRNGTEARIAPDLWNRATGRWEAIMTLLRMHDGPSIVTARLETVTVMEDGAPTKEKTEKVKGQKGLPFDVGVVVQMPKRGQAFLSGVRSLKLDVANDEKRRLNSFSVEKLWEELGVTGEGATSVRQHSAVDAEASAATGDWVQKFNTAKLAGADALKALQVEGESAGLEPAHGLFRAIESELKALGGEA